jgi:hypothetical protein
MARAGLDLREFLDAIGSNPDIGQVDDAYINYSLAPLDVHPVVSKMLYLAWEEILVTSGLSSTTGQYYATIIEGDINNSLVWTGHTHTLSISGVKTTEGDYLHTTSGTTLTMWYQRGASVYDEIVMTNLNGMTSINYQTYHEVALNKLGDENFTIPISWKIFETVTAKEQMEVYQYICRVDMNAIQITHLEWYETAAFYELFEFAMIVISVIIIIISLGTATSFASGLLALVDVIVTNYAIGELIIFVAEITGNEILGAIAGAVAAILIQNPKLMTEGLLLSADTLLDLSTEFVANLKMLQDIQFQELAEDLEEMTTAAQEKIDEEKKNREGIDAVALDSQFLNALQSVDTTRFPAIEGNYAYDQLYNYDSLVSNYHKSQLQTGVT